MSVDVGRTVIFTDLDGTMLGKDLNMEPLRPLLSELHSLGIPVIPVTSKTLGEIALLSRKTTLAKLPRRGFVAVSEMGGAIHATQGLLVLRRGYRPTGLGDIVEYPLATPLEELSDKIDKLIKISGCGERVLRVSQASPGELVDEMGIPLEHASKAIVRKYDEVLIPGDRSCVRKIVKGASRLGLDAIAGARHVHVGKGIGKGRALLLLEEGLRHMYPGGVLGQSICLGDAPIDWSFLSLCRTAVIIGIRGSGGLHGRDHSVKFSYYPSPYPAPLGWAWAVSRILLAK